MNTNIEVFSLWVQEIEVTVTRKAVKHVQLSVYPPEGRVKMTVPVFLGNDAVRNSVIARLAWIRRQRERFKDQARQAKREMVNGETVYWLGKRYRLSIEYASAAPTVAQNRLGWIDMRVRPENTTAQREAILYAWYRGRFKTMVPELLATWEKALGVHAEDWGVKRMKTRWGSCNPKARRIWLNLELAKKPIRCIEYVLVHELVHLLEPRHNHRFKALMTQCMPLWVQYRAELNQEPLADEDWAR